MVLKYEGNPTLSKLSPVIGYNEETKLFNCDDKTLGFCFLCSPLPFANEDLQKQLQSFLSLEFPDNTTVSFFLYRSPDTDSTLNHMINMRFGFHDDLLSPMLIDRSKFLDKHTVTPIIARNENHSWNCGQIVDTKLFISIKVPVSDGIEPKVEETESCVDLQRRSKSALADCGFGPVEADEAIWLRFMGTIINWGKNASWKNEILRPNPFMPLNEQFYDNDCDLIDEDPKRMYLGLKELAEPKDGPGGEDLYETFVQVLSPKTYPPYVYFGSALSYIGDTMGTGKSAMISGNYVICSQLCFVNQQKTTDKIKQKRSISSKAALSPMLRRARPEMGDALDDYEDIYNAVVKDGAKLMQLSFQVILFAPTRRKLTDMSQAMIQYFSTLNFKLLPDRYIQRPLFENCLPLSLERQFLFGGECRRALTLTAKHVMVLLPIFAEWAGTGTPHVCLISRTGQLMTLSLHDSSSNMNALIAAESGSGKSFFTNELLSMYMSEGAQVFIIDVGRSYLKLCNILHGEFIAFDESNLPCMNPFAMVDDIQEEHDTLISILANMIDPVGTLTAQQMAVLNQIFDTEWRKNGNALTIDHIRDALEEKADADNDQRIRDMATQLYPYTSQGRYGKVFSGNNPITFTNRMTVLELEELNSFKNLRSVILLQLIFQIQRSIFLSKDRSRKKIVMIDEAWDLLKQGQTAVFMEHAYRKFRKYGASAIIATQSLKDLYQKQGDGPDVGEAIAANSAFMFLLGQTPETVEQVKKAGYLDLSDGGFEILKGVTTKKGAYSEIFIKSKAGIGIGRLIVSEYEKLMFSTDAKDIAAINYYVDKGYTYDQAIRQVMVDRGTVDADEIIDPYRQTYPEGRLLTDEEYLKLREAERYKVVTDADVRKLESGIWLDKEQMIAYPDGSNIRNPRYAGSVGVPVTDSARKAPVPVKAASAEAQAQPDEKEIPSEHTVITRNAGEAV